MLASPAKALIQDQIRKWRAQLDPFEISFGYVDGWGFILGRNFEAMDPLSGWPADHIPDPGKHRTQFYGFYASRVRSSRTEKESSELPVEAAPARRRCPPSWARLISKVYQADPLVCKGCGGPLKIVAYLTDALSIKRILDHLGLSPPERKKPPPEREVVRVPVDDEGREIHAG